MLIIIVTLVAGAGLTWLWFHRQPTKEYFQDHVVLGKTQICDQKERAELLRALYEGIADWDGRAEAPGTAVV